MRKSLASTFFFITGAAIGAIVALLFAPTRGENIRNTLSYRVKSYTEKLQDLIKILSHTKTASLSQAKTAGQEVINETIQKAKRLLKDANDLAAQLEQ
ncbi:MAG: YtxH domain-containing protein [Bacteroidota bacterium]